MGIRWMWRWTLMPLLVAQWGCVPMVKEMWDVQPVSGRVFDADSQHPLSGAWVENLHQAELRTRTGSSGQFHISGQSRTRLHWAMPASHLERQFWVVRQAGYTDAITVTATLAPPYESQHKLVEVPMFVALAPDPENCRFGQYRIRLGEYLLQQGLTAAPATRHLAELDDLPCSDQSLQRRWREIVNRVYE